MKYLININNVNRGSLLFAIRSERGKKIESEIDYQVCYILLLTFFVLKFKKRLSISFLNLNKKIVTIYIAVIFYYLYRERDIYYA